MFIDINKDWPTQLGNTKDSAIGLPGQIASSANLAFKRETMAAGRVGVSTLAGHSDFTWPAGEATTISSRLGYAFDYAYLESPRSETLVLKAVERAPDTQFTVVQNAKSDFYTMEAQARKLTLKPNAFGQTIDSFKNIDAPNYRLALNESPTPSRLGIPGGHGNAANMNWFTELSFWRGGKILGRDEGPLGALLYKSSDRKMASAPTPASNPGGIMLAHVHGVADDRRTQSPAFWPRTSLCRKLAPAWFQRRKKPAVMTMLRS